MKAPVSICCLWLMMLTCPCRLNGQISQEFYRYGLDVDSLVEASHAAEGEESARLMVMVTLQYFVAGDHETAMAWADRADSACRALGFQAGLAYVYSLKSSILNEPDQIDSSLYYLQRAYAFSGQTGDLDLEDLILYVLASNEWKYRQNIAWARLYLDFLKEKDKNLAHTDIFSKYYNLILCFNQAGCYREEWEASQKLYQRILERGFNTNYRGSSVIPYGHQGKFLKTHGDFAGAIEAYGRCLEDMPRLKLHPKEEKDLEARLFNAMSRTYLEWGRYREALTYQRMAIQSHTSIGKAEGPYGHPIDLSNYLEGTGYSHLRLENYDSALFYFKRSMDIRVDISDELGIAMSHDGIGETFLMLGSYHLAMEHLDSALKKKLNYSEWIAEEFKDAAHPSLRFRTVQESIAISRILLGRLYRDWGKLDLGQASFHEGLETYRRIGDQYGQMIACKELGTTFMQQGDFTNAAGFFNVALRKADSLDARLERARVIYEMGSLSLKTGDEQGFLSNTLSADSIFEAYAIRYEHAQAMKELGLYWLEKGDRDAALGALSSACLIAETDGLKRIAMECARGLTDIYEAKFDPGMTWTYMKRYHDLSREVYDMEALKMISQADAVYHLKQREDELLRLTFVKEMQEFRIDRNRYLLFSLGALLIMLVLFFLLIFRNNVMKSQQKMILLEQRLLRSQMNPHFIFNALANIQDSVFKHDALTASRYLTHFSRLIRNILESTREERISLHTELELVRDYLELQKLRHNHQFDYEIRLNEDLDTDYLEIPPMLSQPFIENAVEHGIRHKEGHGMIIVSYERHNSTLAVTIEDNGVGREAARHFSANSGRLHRSMSSQITLERLEIINRQSRNNGLLKIEDLYDATGKPAGTRVEYEIPVRF